MIPAGLRARRNSPFPSAQLFKKRLNMMAPRSRSGRWVVIPENHSAAQARMMARRTRRRRTRIMTVLIVAVIATGIWALSGSSAAVSLHLLVDVAAVCYGSLLYEARRRRKEQLRKVRRLARHPLSVPRAAWPDIDEESIAL